MSSNSCPCWHFKCQRRRRLYTAVVSPQELQLIIYELRDVWDFIWVHTWQTDTGLKLFSSTSAGMSFPKLDLLKASNSLGSKCPFRIRSRPAFSVPDHLRESNIE